MEHQITADISSIQDRSETMYSKQNYSNKSFHKPTWKNLKGLSQSAYLEVQLVKKQKVGGRESLLAD